MKKIAALTVFVAVMALSVASYAYWGGGCGQGQGWNSAEKQKTLDETYDLRKKIHDRKFDFMEAVRKGDDKKAEALDKEISDMEKAIEEKLGIGGRRDRGCGPRWAGQGYGGGCGNSPCGGYGGGCGNTPCGGGRGW